MSQHDPHCSDPRCEGLPTRERIAEAIAGPARCYLTGVFGGRDTPSFVYTTGAPGDELIVFGLPFETAAALLNDVVAKRLAGAAIVLDTPDDRWANMDTVFKRARPERAREFVRIADWYLGVPVGVLQMVWPDPAGRFPWDAGMDPQYASVPLLWKPLTYEQFTKRTDDPKLAYIERWLDDRGIAHRRRGHSFHGPILEVESARLDEAWSLLGQDVGGVRFDDIDDDDPMFREGGAA